VVTVIRMRTTRRRDQSEVTPMCGTRRVHADWMLVRWNAVSRERAARGISILARTDQPS